MAQTKVVVHGVLGRMGQEVLRTVCREVGLAPVGSADRMASKDSLELPDDSGSIPISKSLDDVLGDAQVVVDFSGAEGAALVIRTAAARRVNVVVGTTGLEDVLIEEADNLAQEHQVWASSSRPTSRWAPFS